MLYGTKIADYWVSWLILVININNSISRKIIKFLIILFVQFFFSDTTHSQRIHKTILVRNVNYYIQLVVEKNFTNLQYIEKRYFNYHIHTTLFRDARDCKKNIKENERKTNKIKNPIDSPKWRHCQWAFIKSFTIASDTLLTMSTIFN